MSCFGLAGERADIGAVGASIEGLVVRYCESQVVSMHDFEALTLLADISMADISIGYIAR